MALATASPKDWSTAEKMATTQIMWVSIRTRSNEEIVEGERTLLSLNSLRLDATKMSSEVLDEVRARRVVHDLGDECAGLLEVHCYPKPHQRSSAFYSS